MAKGKSSRGNAHGTPSSLTSLLSPSKNYPLQPSTVTFIVPTPADVLGVVDRRTYTPTPYRVISSPRKAARLIPDRMGQSIRDQVGPVPSGVQFANPKHVAICVRRKARREVLHALKLTKKRGKGGGKTKRNLWSTVKC